MKADFLKGEVVYVNLPDNGGHVQTGSRPAIVVSNNIHNHHGVTVHVVPLTTKINKTGIYHAYIPKTEKNHLKTDSLALVEDMVCVDKDCVERHIGKISLDSKEWSDISDKIKLYFN